MNRHHLSCTASTIFIVVVGGGFYVGWVNMPPIAHAVFGYVVFGITALSIALLMLSKLHTIHYHDHLVVAPPKKPATRKSKGVR